jgi:SWI/SNF-related matrix-associated actin-dependent regulator of chromatin subfamily A3
VYCKKSNLEKIRSRGTLVVCPVSLVGQWVSEAKSKLTEGSTFKIYEYHGGNRIRSSAKLAEYDLVVTTFETLSSDFCRQLPRPTPSDPTGSRVPKGCPCNEINWFRIVLDESHKIKGKSGMTNAVRVLSSMRRWCVTGTPMNNSFEDLNGQFSFFGIYSCDKNFWTTNAEFAGGGRTKSR